MYTKIDLSSIDNRITDEYYINNENNTLYTSVSRHKKLIKVRRLLAGHYLLKGQVNNKRVRVFVHTDKLYEAKVFKEAIPEMDNSTKYQSNPYGEVKTKKQWYEFYIAFNKKAKQVPNVHVPLDWFERLTRVFKLER